MVQLYLGDGEQLIMSDSEMELSFRNRLVVGMLRTTETVCVLQGPFDASMQAEMDLCNP